MLSVAFAVFASPAAAQQPTADTIPLRCTYSNPKSDHLGAKTLPGGFVVTISRATDEVENACSATVSASTGQQVFSEAGFSVAIDHTTGMDVDADGSPDLVLYYDVGGGNHCCWKFTVLSFAPTPRKLLEFPWSGATEFREDPGGRVTLWSWEGGLFGTDGSMAGRLFAQRVYRWSGSRLVDETPAHCAEIKADTARYQTPAPDADARRRLEQFGAESDSAYGIATSIELLILQEVFCQRYDAAREIARTMWPASSRAAFFARYHDMVVAAYPEYAPALRDWR